MLYLCIMLIFVFFATFASYVGEGLWSSTIAFLAILCAGVFGVAAGFPLGAWARVQLDKDISFTWYFAFAGVWLAFFLFVLVFRILADRISRVRMRFVPPLETAGGLVMCLLTAVMFTSFAAFTLLIPMAAGEWDLKKAEGWQQSTFTMGSAPFITVYNSVTGQELAPRVNLK